MNNCDKDVTKMENEEWQMEIEKWEIVVSIHITPYKIRLLLPPQGFRPDRRRNPEEAL